MAVGDFAVADVVIGVTVVVSAVFGVLRGFVKEVASLVIWLAALLLGVVFAAPIGELIGLNLDPRLQNAVGFATVFIVVLIAGAIVQRILGGLVESTGLTGTDRMLGLLFGAARGTVVVIGALIFLKPSAEEPDWWSDSTLIPPLLALEGDVLNLVDYVADKVGGADAELEPSSAEEVSL